MPDHGGRQREAPRNVIFGKSALLRLTTFVAAIGLLPVPGHPQPVGNTSQLQAGWSGNTLWVTATTPMGAPTYRCTGIIHGYGGGPDVAAPFNTIVSGGGVDRHVADFQFANRRAFWSASLSEVRCDVTDDLG